jgi:hypothetical protein
VAYCSIDEAQPVAERRAMLTEAAASPRRMGDSWMAAAVLTMLGTRALLDGERDEAERLAQEGLRKARAVDSETAIGLALTQLGYSALARGHVGLARERFAEAVHAYQRIQDREGLTYTLEGLAAIALAQGKPEPAARAVGAADAARELIGVAVYPTMERTVRAPLVSAVEHALGTAAFGAARAAGTETDLDEATEQLLTLTTWTARNDAPDRSNSPSSCGIAPTCSCPASSSTQRHTQRSPRDAAGSGPGT